MVDISSQNNKINVTVSSSGNTANTNVTPDYAQYYSEKSKEWATSNKIVDNTDYSSKYYANESKKQADISTAKTTEVVESGNTAVSNIESARDNAITDITNQESLSVDNVNTAGVTQVTNVNSAGTTQINLAKEQVTLATNQANIATEQATIATNKTSEVVESGNTALNNIDNAKSEALTEIETLHSSSVTDITNLKNTSISNITTAKNNAITSITNQETTSKNALIDEGATQIGLIQNEGATQIANVQSTGFYMRDDKLYFINSQGEETEFKSGGSGLEVCDIGMALYVDETKGLRRYLNGQIVDINANTQAFLDRLKEITTLYPSLLTTEENWQAAKTMSVFGQVGKFVFNYADDGVTVVSVRIPRVVNIQGLFDLQNLGMTVAESLPNITGGVTWNIVCNSSTSSTKYTGSFSSSTKTSPRGIEGGATSRLAFGDLDFNANNSSPTYKDGAHVQPEAIQYPYFIQIATGSETENNIINEIELNNPYSLFDSKYSDHELNNLSWLKSNGQWNAKAVYTDAYDKLLKVYNGTETVEGLSVKLSTESYTNYDFVLNTAEESFRLPIDTIDHPINSTGTLPVKGNGMTLGLTDGTTNLGLNFNNVGRHTGSPFISKSYGTSVGKVQTEFIPPVNDKDVGITTDSTKSGIVADLTSKKANLYLYFYVGETVQNANLIDAGRIGEQLATKTDMLQASGAGMPSDKYINLTLGASDTTYTAPVNGWVYLKKACTATNQFIQIWVLNGVGPQIYSSASGQILSTYVPVIKGKTFGVVYTADGETLSFKFIYAEGSK